MCSSGREGGIRTGGGVGSGMVPRLQSITGSSVLSGSGGSVGVDGEVGPGSTTATAGSSTSSSCGTTTASARDERTGSGGSGSGNVSRKRMSRITYDRDQGVRFYQGAETTDSNDCDCEDI